MKTKILYFSIIIFMTACSGNGDDKIGQLEKLKKELSAIKEKMNILETEIALSDTTTDKFKLVGVTEMTHQKFDHFIEVQASVEGDEDILLSAEAAGKRLEACGLRTGRRYRPFPSSPSRARTGRRPPPA